MQHFSRIILQPARMLTACLCALALILLSAADYRPAAQLASTQAPASVTASSSQPEAVPQSVVCALWRTDWGFTSTIRVKNALVVAPLSVTPVLYMADGTEYDLPPLNLSAGGIGEVSVNSAIENAPPPLAAHLSQYGSAALRYSYPAPGIIAADMQILDSAQSLIFGYPFIGPMGKFAPKHTLEALWWRHDPGVSGFVSLTNTTNQERQVGLEIVGSEGTALPRQPLTLAAHEAHMFDLDSLLSGLPKEESQSGGLRIQFDGKVEDVIFAGGVENPEKGYSAIMPALLHDPNQDSSTPPSPMTLVSVGLLLGKPNPAAGFPTETKFTPFAILRNSTPNLLQVAPEVNYMADGQPRSFRLPAENLLPSHARRIPLESILPSLGLAHYNGTITISFSYSGHSGDLIAATGSTDQTDNYVFQVIPQGVGTSLAKDVPLWSLAGGNDTMFTLWNPSDAPEDIVASFSWNGTAGRYSLPIHLAAKASQTIDVAQLIAAHQPDGEGNVIPSDVQEGSVEFAGPDGPRQRIQLNLSSGIFNVQTATCNGYVCICCFGFTFFGLAPSPVSSAVGGSSVQVTATAHWSNGSTSDETNRASWSSGNTAVATVQTSGQSSPGLVSPVGGGSSTVTAFESVAQAGQVCGYYSPQCGNTTGQGSAQTKVCDFSLGPGAFNARCDGTQNNQQYVATVTPSLSECAFQPLASSCSWTVVSGAIDSAGNVNNLSSTSASCNALYFAGPGTSGQQVGTVRWSMSLVLNGKTVPHTQNADATCK